MAAIGARRTRVGIVGLRRDPLAPLGSEPVRSSSGRALPSPRRSSTRDTYVLAPWRRGATGVASGQERGAERAAALVQVPRRGVHSMRSAIEMASVAVRRVVGVWDTNCYWRHCLRCGCPSEASAVTPGVAAGDARRAHIAAVGNGRPSVSLHRGGCT